MMTHGLAKTSPPPANDGDNIELSIDPITHALRILNVGSTAGGTSDTDETAFTAGVTTGTPIMGYDSGTGKLLVVALSPGTRNLATAVTVTPVQSNTSSAPAQIVVSTSAAIVLAANAARKRLILQNIGTTVIYITFGATSPTTSIYHIALPAGGTQNDGSSFIWRDEMWTGVVRAISSASGGLLVAVELT